MSRLGYDRFIAAGSDWGASVSTCIALDHPERLLGLHLVPPLVGPPDSPADARLRTRRFVDGPHDGDLNAVIARQRLLDNVTLYWLTRTGASSIRLYWESIAEVSRWFTAATNDVIDVPTACSVFPKEVPRPSRRWAERRFTNIVHWGEPPRGGHFAAWEQPQSFVIESRAAVRGCRQ